MQWKPETLLKCVGGHLMVYNCIKSYAYSKLVKVYENLIFKSYISLQGSPFLPDYEDGEMFQYDCAPCHISLATKTFLLQENV